MTLRRRLLLGFSIIFAVVVAASVFVVTAQRNQLYDQVDEQLLATPLPAPARAGQPSAPRPGDDRVEQAEELGDVESISDLYVAVIELNGDVRPLIRGQVDDIPDVAELASSPPSDTYIGDVEGIDGVSNFRVLFRPNDGTAPASIGTVIAVETDDIDDTIRQLTYTFIGVAALILLVLVLIASWVNRFGLRPINAMTDVAAAISAGDRERRAETASESTEAGRLGHAFNVMLDERDDTETRLRQFVSNASHELRTPLTSIRGYLDLYAAGGFRKPGELDDAVRRMQVEAERMNLLVEDLLVLAKFDEEQPLDITSVDVGELLHDVAALGAVAAPDRDIVVDAPPLLELDADRLRLHQAVAALVDNAMRHTPDDARIRIHAASTSSSVDLSVADTGPGLTADEAAVVFDRFSRGDRSRARTTGGSGLGLSITQAIVHAHGGTISVTSTPGHGAEFVISLPMSPSGADAHP